MTRNGKSSSLISPRPVWERVPAGQVRGCTKINNFTVPSSGCADYVLQPTSPRGRSYNKAFTLIELLVVVLIIGILSAIALPQYQKAVEKARMTKAMIQVRALAEAQKEYYLANGSYADTFDKLSLDFPGTPNEANNQLYHKNITLYLDWIGHSLVYAAYLRNEWGNGRWYITYDLTSNTLYCEAYKEDTKSNDVCKTFSNSPITCPWTNNLENCYPI